MTSKDISEQEWISILAAEAERDLIFLWNITSGSFGGRKYAASELPSVVARVTAALFNENCQVGFGNPDSKEWQAATEVLRTADPGTEIATRWLAAPKEFEFLVFARRPKPSR